MVMVTTIIAAIGGTMMLIGCCYCVYINTGPGSGTHYDDKYREWHEWDERDRKRSQDRSRGGTVFFS